jgi:hypothetical protein
MVKRIELLNERLIAGSARPEWMLLALSFLFSGALVLAIKSIQRAG